MQDERLSAPGLKWRQRKNGPPAAYWTATPEAIAAGFSPSTIRIHYDASDAQHLVDIAARCRVLTGQMRAFADRPRTAIRFDGTIRALVDVYLNDPDSPFRRLKRSTQHPYEHYARLIGKTIGARRIAECDGRDVQRWFDGWKDTGDGVERVAKAQTCLAILKSALAFGVMCRHPHCRELGEIIRVMRFKSPPPRRSAPTAGQIVALRKAAHAEGHPGIALACAMQFETMQRQWDVIGQWVPLAAPEPSAIIAGRLKWIGPQWSDLREGMILRWRPTKTRHTSGVEIEIDLTLCPMVMEELQHVAPEARRGPIVQRPGGGPYDLRPYQKTFRRIARAAGVPDHVWSRDIRAGGITDARMSGAALEDAAKAAGHTDPRTTARVYDRDTLEAHRRVAAARTKNNG